VAEFEMHFALRSIPSLRLFGSVLGLVGGPTCNIERGRFTVSKSIAQAENFDYLHRLGDHYAQVRRYAPAFLEGLQMTAAPAAREILDAVGVLKTRSCCSERMSPC
jgi:hypothetical protein